MMEKIKIALLLDEKGREGRVAPEFALAERLVMLEAPDGAVFAEEAREGKNDEALARRIVEAGCECALCGPIEEQPFLILADEGGVTRYNAAGLALGEALERFNSDQLELIRDYLGGKGCSGSGAGECHEHD